MRKLILALAILLAPVFSHASPCHAVLCLTTPMGVPGACAPYRSTYFAIIVYSSTGYDPNLTAAARRAYINGCAGATAADKGRIDSTYGRLFSDPGR